MSHYSLTHTNEPTAAAGRLLSLAASIPFFKISAVRERLTLSNNNNSIDGRFRWPKETSFLLSPLLHFSLLSQKQIVIQMDLYLCDIYFLHKISKQVIIIFVFCLLILLLFEQTQTNNFLLLHCKLYFIIIIIMIGRLRETIWQRIIWDDDDE